MRFLPERILPVMLEWHTEVTQRFSGGYECPAMERDIVGVTSSRIARMAKP